MPGVEPGSRADLALAGYKAAALPLSYTPAGYHAVAQDSGIRGGYGKRMQASIMLGC